MHAWLIAIAVTAGGVQPQNFPALPPDFSIRERFYILVLGGVLDVNRDYIYGRYGRNIPRSEYAEGVVEAVRRLHGLVYEVDQVLTQRRIGGSQSRNVSFVSNNIYRITNMVFSSRQTIESLIVEFDNELEDMGVSPNRLRNELGWIEFYVRQMRVPRFGEGNEPYPDVPKGHWAYDDIMNLKREGIMIGYPNGTFRPGEG